VLDRSHDETVELAAKVFELSQTLKDQWLTGDYVTKRRLLEIVCLNCRLDGIILCPENEEALRRTRRRAVSRKKRRERDSNSR
jgi:hypothetical protein